MTYTPPTLCNLQRLHLLLPGMWHNIGSWFVDMIEISYLSSLILSFESQLYAARVLMNVSVVLKMPAVQWEKSLWVLVWWLILLTKRCALLDSFVVVVLSSIPRFVALECHRFVAWSKDRWQICRQAGLCSLLLVMFTRVWMLETSPS